MVLGKTFAFINTVWTIKYVISLYLDLDVVNYLLVAFIAFTGKIMKAANDKFLDPLVAIATKSCA